MTPASARPKDTQPLTPYQKRVVGVLAFLQFTIILDFMILSPLGATLIPTLKITPAQFGRVVSAYAFSAGISGLLAAGFADRFDRKKFLLFFYTGFLVGTLLCGLAPDYRFLLIARMVTGMFGGVVGSIVLAITTDLFPVEQRGRVMGVVQTAFSASQILGLPIGLYLSNRWGWHAPFLMIVGVSGAVGVVILFFLHPLKGHLTTLSTINPLQHLIGTLSRPRYLQGFATTALLSTGGFMLMPFASAFSVHNLKIEIDRLPFVYLVTGACTIVAGPVIGRLSDRVGKFPVFGFGSLLTIFAVFIYTHLGVTPLGLVILVSALLYVGVSSRMISASALMSSLPAPVDRGSYMAISASIQQISGGLAAALGGWVVVQNAQGALEHYDTVGYIVMVSSCISVTMMYFINRVIQRGPQ